MRCAHSQIISTNKRGGKPNEKKLFKNQSECGKTVHRHLGLPTEID